VISQVVTTSPTVAVFDRTFCNFLIMLQKANLTNLLLVYSQNCVTKVKKILATIKEKDLNHS